MSCRSFLLLLAVVFAFCSQVNAQSSPDGPPVIEPHRRAQPAPQPARVPTARLAVECDVTCNWSLDGRPQGVLDAGQLTSVAAFPGDHVVTAGSSDGPERTSKDVTLNANRQTLVHLTMAADRNARLDREKADAAIRDVREQARARNTQGYAYFSQKRYGDARPLFEQSCQSGLADACYNLGSLYNNGQGVAQDFATARRLFEQACNAGQMGACNNIGYMYGHGRGVEQNYQQARLYYQKACDGQEMGGCSNLGFLYDKAHGVEQNYTLARELYQKACIGKDIESCNNLAILDVAGAGAPKNPARAFQIFQKACTENDNPTACWWLGALYEQGNGVTADPTAARRAYQKACHAGASGACDAAAKMH